MIASDSQQRRLVRASVVGLLNYFSHEVNFPADNAFVCLHGPNGVGKTKLLELIHAALSGQVSALTETPFLELDLSFDDGASLVITQSAVDQLAAEEPSLTWRINLDGREIEIKPTGDNSRKALVWLERQGLIRRRMGPGSIWFTVLETGERVDAEEVLLRFALALPRELRPVQAEVAELLGDLAVRLIDVGRLRKTEVLAERPGVLRPEHSEISAPQVRAQDLSRRILDARSAYSEEAQSLDSTYPNRLLDIDSAEPPSESEIRERYEALVKRQEMLAGAGLLGKQTARLELDGGDLEDWHRAAIDVHLQDSEQKLAVFDRLLSRVDLFMDVVNSKFNHKSMQVNDRRGFAFTSDLSHEDLKLDGLSSGEKHLLVMMYDLIFNTDLGELVLIDEPEISLHVAWQKQFLDDLTRIADLKGVRFIVATHSPQIVGKYLDRMVPLGSVE